ncbi:MAG TPA: nitrate reductase associated protein [Candidatus Binatia bacterium]
MFHRFRYEAEFYPSLSRIPLHVRMKLDLTGIRISLKDWLAFDFAERAALCHLPCRLADERQAFAGYLDFLSRKYCGTPVVMTDGLDSALWNKARVPEAVRKKSADSLKAITAEEWSNWRFHQRYALYKTAISQSQPDAFSQLLEQLRDPSAAVETEL